MLVVEIMHSQRVLWLSLALIICCPTFLLSQPNKYRSDSASECKCRLHATLHAEDGYQGDPRFEHITFRLRNDCNQALDSAKKSWTLVIGDHEAPDPVGQLWMEPEPPGGYDLVKPGATN